MLTVTDAPRTFNRSDSIHERIAFSCKCKALVLSTIMPHLTPDLFLDFLEVLFDLVLSSDKIIIVCDFNIHLDADNDSLNSAFNLLLDELASLYLIIFINI